MSESSNLKHASGIDTIDIGKDYGADGSGWSLHAPNAQSYGLLMLLQSLPDTRRKVTDGNTQFVDRQSYYTEQLPVRASSADPANIIVINPAPTIDLQTDQHLTDRACEQIDPERFELERVKLQELEELKLAARERIENKRLENRAAAQQGGDEDALNEAYLAFRHHETGLISTYNFEVKNIYRARTSHKKGYAGLDEAVKQLTATWRAEQAKPIATLLREGGIEFRGPTGDDSLIEIDQTQPDFDAKLSALMDAHRAEILEHYKGVDFIIPKPDGTALDKEQAARVIAQRQAAMAEDAAALKAAEEHYLGRTKPEPHVLGEGRSFADTPTLVKNGFDTASIAR